MTETEITVQVLDDLETIKNTLANKGFCNKETFELNDGYYSKYSLQEVLSFDYANLIKQSILLREIVDEKTQVQLIYKNKTLDKNGTVVAEEKYKTKLESKVAAEQILKSAGLVRWGKLLQKCYIYSNGKFELAVQVVDGLGIFIEAEETEQMKGFLPEQKINALKQQVNSLGLTLGKDYSCKKPYMLLHKNKQ